MLRLDDKVAIITGGARGQGAATAELFAQQGAKVVIADVLIDEGTALSERIGASARFIELDVRDEPSWAALTRSALAAFGGIDILVNNAGIDNSQRLMDTTKQRFEQILAVNLVGPYLGIQAVVPHMSRARRGSIINISSVQGLRGAANLSAYDASKWALRGVTKSLALELAPLGIRVNSIHPGAIDTPMLNAHGADMAQVAKDFRIGMGRVGTPAEVAHASLFFASDEASYVTGAELAVDGGWTAGVYLNDIADFARLK